MKKSIYSAAILASGCMWSTQGVFSRGMDEMGFDTFTIALVRYGFSAILYCMLVLFSPKENFRIRPKDFWIFFCTSWCASLFSSVCYYYGLSLMSLSASSILLYTAPFFVIIISAILFKEKITKRKLIALFMAFGGCCLVCGLLSGDTTISFMGVLVGLGSGIGYALGSIFVKIALGRGYRNATINFYSASLSTIGALILCGINGSIGKLHMPTFSSWLIPFALAVLTFFVPNLMYTYGLDGLEAGRASIMASIEPVVATILGAVIFGELLDVPSIIGVVLVIGAIVIVNMKEKQAVTQ